MDEYEKLERELERLYDQSAAWAAKAIAAVAHRRLSKSGAIARFALSGRPLAGASVFCKASVHGSVGIWSASATWTTSNTSSTCSTRQNSPCAHGALSKQRRSTAIHCLHYDSIVQLLNKSLNIGPVKLVPTIRTPFPELEHWTGFWDLYLEIDSYACIVLGILM